MRSLVERGIPIHWNPSAMVEEQIPPDRSSLAYVRDRKYRHGQQRIVMMRGEGGAIVQRTYRKRRAPRTGAGSLPREISRAISPYGGSP